MKLRRTLIAQYAPSLGEVVRSGSPGPHIFSSGDAALDPAELEQISKIWGIQFADRLITDHRWPACNQAAAIRAAGLVVERAITGIVAILDSGDDFRPHTAMMAATINTAFWNSMPHAGKKGTSIAPAS
jgi:hypothetical protein